MLNHVYCRFSDADTRVPTVGRYSITGIMMDAVIASNILFFSHLFAGDADPSTFGFPCIFLQSDSTSHFGEKLRFSLGFEFSVSVSELKVWGLGFRGFGFGFGFRAKGLGFRVSRFRFQDSLCHPVLTIA